MPQITVECTPGVTEVMIPDVLLPGVQEAAVASGVIPLANLKLRLYVTQHYLVQGEHKDFVHVSVALLAGRTKEELAHLSKLIWDYLDGALPGIENITVDVRETTPGIYRRREPGAADGQ